MAFQLFFSNETAETTKNRIFSTVQKIKQANMNNLLIDNQSKCKTETKEKLKTKQVVAVSGSGFSENSWVCQS